MICELGFPIKTIEFKQPRRIAGVSANNFFSLYDIAILGIISHSIMPIRVMGILGFFLSIASFTIGLIYLMLKILYWDEFNAGIVPIIIGVFFMFGLLFIFISLIGEYIGSIHTYLRNRPIVVEKERINFD